MKIIIGRIPFLAGVFPTFILLMTLLIVDASSFSSSTWQLLDLATSTISKFSTIEGDGMINGEGMMDSSARSIDKLSCSIVELYEGFYSNEVSSIFC